MKKNRYEFQEEEFNLIYQITLKNNPNNQGQISFKSFIEIMRNLKKEYNKYKTILKWYKNVLVLKKNLFIIF